MTTAEALRTRVDDLQWKVNRLETENRRLQEENPEQSRALALEAELEQSKNEAAELKDQVDEHRRRNETVSEDRDGLAEQLESERRAAAELHKALTRSEACESELTDSLGEKEAELERLSAEEKRREEARELQYFRTLQTEREKWEGREQRALEEVDRLRRDGGSGAGGVDYSALSEKLEEAYQQQQSLQTKVSEGESENSSLKGELTECRSENEELRAELDLLRIKVRRLEQSTAEASETPRPSSRLDARASAFTPTVRFSLPEETTSPTLTETRPLVTAMESFALPSLPVRSGVTLPARTAVSSVSTSAMDMPISTPSLATATVPAATVTGSHLSVPNQIVAATPSPSLAVSQAVPAATVTAGSHLSVPDQIMAAVPTPSLAVSQAGRGTTPSMIPVASTTPTLTTGTVLPYPVVHPSPLPQIPNFHGGDQRDGETGLTTSKLCQTLPDGTQASGLCTSLPPCVGMPDPFTGLVHRHRRAATPSLLVR